MTKSIAWFVSPHGFGHAARASAVIAAIHAIDPKIRFHIFTTVPEFFFKESLEPGCFTYHDQLTDIGLAQRSALEPDLPETIRRLDSFLPFDEGEVARLAELLKESRCAAVVCEIAPLGIAVAKAAGIPSIQVENFTWDWIYHEFAGDFPALVPHMDYLRRQFDSVDFHIRALPAVLRGNPHLITPPIGRKSRIPAAEIKSKLGQKMDIPQNARVLLITMGGVPEDLPFLHRLGQFPDTFFVIPGSPAFSREGNVIRLPYDSGFYHPHLIAASDAVMGKPGYSTLAEIYLAGVPYGYIARDNFRESRIMEAFIQKEMKGISFSETGYRSGAWLDRLPELLELPRIPRTDAQHDGAAQAAQFILNSI